MNERDALLKRLTSGGIRYDTTGFRQFVPGIQFMDPEQALTQLIGSQLGGSASLPVEDLLQYVQRKLELLLGHSIDLQTSIPIEIKESGFSFYPETGLLHTPEEEMIVLKPGGRLFTAMNLFMKNPRTPITTSLFFQNMGLPLDTDRQVLHQIIYRLRKAIKDPTQIVVENSTRFRVNRWIHSIYDAGYIFSETVPKYAYND